MIISGGKLTKLILFFENVDHILAVFNSLIFSILMKNNNNNDYEIEGGGGVGRIHSPKGITVLTQAQQPWRRPRWQRSTQL